MTPLKTSPLVTSLFSVMVLATACSSSTDDGAGSSNEPGSTGGHAAPGTAAGSTTVSGAMNGGAADAAAGSTSTATPGGGNGDASVGSSSDSGSDAGCTSCTTTPTQVDPALQLAHVQAAGKMFSAQYLEGYASDPDITIDQLTSQGAPMPAAVGVPRASFGDMNTKSDTKRYYLNEANKYLAMGTQVMVSHWAGNPNLFNDGGNWMCPGPSNQPGTGGEDMGNSDGNNYVSPTDFANLTNPATTIGANWKATLDLVATDLAQLDGIVLFREFLEMNGSNGMWWDNQSPADYISLWRYTHDYLNVTKGLAGKLRWVWAINAGEGNYETFYPGDDYVDVAALDSYGANAAIYTGQIDPEGLKKSPMGSLFSHHKPVILSEMGCGAPVIPAPNTCDYTQLLASLKQGAAASGLPLPAAMYIFWQGWALYDQNGGSVAGKATAYLEDPVMVNLSDLKAYD